MTSQNKIAKMNLISPTNDLDGGQETDDGLETADDQCIKSPDPPTVDLDDVMEAIDDLCLKSANAKNTKSDVLEGGPEVSDDQYKSTEVQAEAADGTESIEFITFDDGLEVAELTIDDLNGGPETDEDKYIKSAESTKDKLESDESPTLEDFHAKSDSDILEGCKSAKSKIDYDKSIESAYLTTFEGLSAESTIDDVDVGPEAADDKSTKSSESTTVDDLYDGPEDQNSKSTKSSTVDGDPEAPDNQSAKSESPTIEDDSGLPEAGAAMPIQSIDDIPEADAAKPIQFGDGIPEPAEATGSEGHHGSLKSTCIDDKVNDHKLPPQVASQLMKDATELLELEKFDDVLQVAEKFKIHSSLQSVIYAVKALVGLGKLSEAKQAIDERLRNPKGSRSLLSLLKLMRRQIDGHYDVGTYLAEDKPVLNCLEYTGPVKIADVGEKGRGLVAVDAIKAGELVLACKAFVMSRKILATGPIEMLKAMNFTNLITDIGKKIVKNPELGKKVYNLYAGPELGYLNPEKDDCSQVFQNRIRALCLANWFSGRSQENQNFVSHGLFLMASYINHSCSESNCLWIVVGDFLFIRALKNIAKEEEILISYVSLIRSLEFRHASFVDSPFECKCTLCQLERNESNDVRVTRDRIMTRLLRVCHFPQLPDTFFNDFLSDIEQLKDLRKDHSQLNYMLLKPLEALSRHYFQDEKQRENALDSLKEVFTMFENTSMADFMIETVGNIIICYTLMRKKGQALRWLRTLKELYVRVYGSFRSFNKLHPEFTDVLILNGIYI